MQSIVSHFLSIMGAASMVSLLIAAIMLLHMIQQAFARSGLVWGVIATLYPAGAYMYCRKNWDLLRGKFLTVSVLFIAALIMFTVVKIAT